MSPADGRLAIMNPFYDGWQGDAKQMAVIDKFKPGNHVRSINAMFGGVFNETVQNGSSGVVDTRSCPYRGGVPPCPYMNFHWNASGYHSMLRWLASQNVCEVSIYPSPGGNVRAGVVGPHGPTPQPGRLWTTYLAPWMMEGLEEFRNTPGCSSTVVLE